VLLDRLAQRVERVRWELAELVEEQDTAMHKGSATIPGMTKRRYDWTETLAHAKGIVRGYGTRVTLRQLFYRLVADGTLPNQQSYYQRLSAQTADGRRQGTFPSLLDRTSRIEEFMSFDGPDAARAYIRDLYRRDRTEGQPWTIVLGVEKGGMSAQLDEWFTDPLGIPHVALGGYASQTLCDEVRRHIRAHDRPAVRIYAGDFDPTGVDIDRDFEARVGVFDKVVRVALNVDQIGDLPENPAPDKLNDDPRAARFVRRFGELVQYEVDALPPDTLRNLYRTALGDYWDDDAYQAVLKREQAERDEL
jgi:hypothetical protein